MTHSIKLYYAVSRSGQGYVFTEMPTRNEHFGIWCGEMYGFITSLIMYMEGEKGFSLPKIKWSDDPVEITLTASY